MTAPNRPAITVRELSLALAHRWEPERLFMFVYTAYLDESGTHDGSLVTVMGGLLAKADQWERFEKGFAKAQRQHGFRVWHTKKFKNRTGDFKGWTPEQCKALYWDLGRLTSFGLTEAMAVTLNNADYETHYKSGHRPPKARLDTKYGLCFRVCLYNCINEIFKRRHKKKIPVLHVVLEAGHPNYGDAERIFFEIKKEFEGAGNEMLRTISKADKEDSGQLMMADFAAHSEYLLETKALQGTPRNMVPAAVPKGMTGSTHIQSTPEMLKKWRDEIIEKAMPKKGPNARPSDSPNDQERSA